MHHLERSVLTMGAAGLAAWLLTRPGRKSSYDFAEKNILITGGSRGLGLVLARELTRQGARLALCARDAAELDRAASDLSSLGSSPRTFPCDTSQADQVSSMVSAAESDLGPIDVLINNASIITVGPVETMTRQDFEESLAITFWGAFNTVNAVLPSMRGRRQGRIVNISSIGGKVSVPHLLPYNVSKFALVGYSHGLRAELAKDGIIVTTICPGLMRTGSPRNALFKGKHEAEYAWFSIGDSLPLLTMSAEQAAHEIIECCRRGDAEAILSLPAQLLALSQALFPEWTTDVLALVNRLLPGPNGSGTQAVPGRQSTSAVSPSLLTALTEKAARQNNEIPPEEQ